MFIKNNDNGLVFIKSMNVNVFPCGRRRSNLIDSAGSDDKYYIPFDPEARLNTEANNRKHSGLNGFTQDYISNWTYNTTEGLLSIVLAGYLFNIKLDPGYLTAGEFGTKIEESLSISNIDSIYANIQLADIKFFEGSPSVPEASTEILRDQTLTGDPATCLDFLIEGKEANKDVSENYYFSGLSFSNFALDKDNSPSGYKRVSLKILTKDITDSDSEWKIHEPSRLPNIEHGDTVDSVKICGDVAVCATDNSEGTMTIDGDITSNGNMTVDGNLNVCEVESDLLKQNGHTVSLLDVVTKTASDGKIYYQLQFTGAVESVTN